MAQRDESKRTPEPRKQKSNPPVRTSPPKKGMWMKGISTHTKQFRVKKRRG